MDDKTNHYQEMSAGALKLLCRDRKLHLANGAPATKENLVARLVREDQEQAEWEALKANPPPLPTGYRFVLVTGEIHPVVFTHSWMDDHRYHSIHAEIVREYPLFSTEGSGHTLEMALDQLHTNLGANYRIREFLRPDELSRDELLAEIEALKARKTPSPWIAP